MQNKLTSFEKAAKKFDIELQFHHQNSYFFTTSIFKFYFDHGLQCTTIHRLE